MDKPTTPDVILDELRQVAQTHLGISPVALTPQTHLLRDLKLDSIQQITLIVELENQFKICFDPGDAESVSSVASVVELIRAKLDGPRDREPPR